MHCHGRHRRHRPVPLRHARASTDGAACARWHAFSGCARPGRRPGFSKAGRGARTVNTFFSKAVTYPLLFAIGITLMKWEVLISALTIANLITIVMTVITMTAV